MRYAFSIPKEQTPPKPEPKKCKKSWATASQRRESTDSPFREDHMRHARSTRHPSGRRVSPAAQCAVARPRRELLVFLLHFRTMKIHALLLLAALLIALPLLAQPNPALPTPASANANDSVQVLRTPSWNKGFYVGGSQSFANTPSAQSFLVAARIGRVLTHELGHNSLRGSFEMAIDLVPINQFWIGGNSQYAGAINPFIAKWNFTAGKTVSPYVAAVGGIVFSPHQLPAPDTSQVNFTSGAELGAQWFHHSKNSIDFSVKIYHLSNASLGRYNPGINGAVQFMVGYTWH